MRAKIFFLLGCIASAIAVAQKPDDPTARRDYAIEIIINSHPVNIQKLADTLNEMRSSGLCEGIIDSSHSYKCSYKTKGKYKTIDLLLGLADRSRATYVRDYIEMIPRNFCISYAETINNLKASDTQLISYYSNIGGHIPPPGQTGIYRKPIDLPKASPYYTSVGIFDWYERNVPFPREDYVHASFWNSCLTHYTFIGDFRDLYYIFGAKK